MMHLEKEANHKEAWVSSYQLLIFPLIMGVVAKRIGKEVSFIFLVTPFLLEYRLDICD